MLFFLAISFFNLRLIMYICIYYINKIKLKSVSVVLALNSIKGFMKAGVLITKIGLGRKKTFSVEVNEI